MLAAAVAAPVRAGEIGSVPGGNPNYTPAPPKEGYNYPDCYCTDSAGRRVELGEMACLTIGTRQVLARCDMSVNNPTWRHQTEGCPGV
jgi:hypothetical protein